MRDGGGGGGYEDRIRGGEVEMPCWLMIQPCGKNILQDDNGSTFNSQCLEFSVCPKSVSREIGRRRSQCDECKFDLWRLSISMSCPSRQRPSSQQLQSSSAYCRRYLLILWNVYQRIAQASSILQVHPPTAPGC